MAAGPLERSRDFERFLTFIDAVVAIAITLLVLPLVDLTVDLDRPVTQLLHEHLAEIGGFLLSFVVIASSWMIQHRVISTVVVQDPVVIRLLLFWTLTIVVLPFPTSLVAQSGHEPVSKILYMGTMALTSAALTVLAWRIGGHRAIRDSDDRPSVLRPLLFTVGYLLALAISLLVPRLGYYPLLLQLLPDRAIALWRHRSEGRTTS